MQRRRVQAQRKFAQGAHIPSVASTNTHKINYKTQKDDDLSVFITTTATTATQLLDILSLKNCHEHLQPFVLLERLPSGTKPPETKTNKNVEENIPIIKNGMCLRQSTRNRQRYHANRCTKAKNKLARVSLHESNDDETPLLYLKSPNRKKRAKKGNEKKKRDKIPRLAENKTSSTTAANTTDPISFMENVTNIANEQINDETSSKKDSAVVNESPASQFHPNETEFPSNETISTTALVETPVIIEKEPQPSTSFANNSTYYDEQNLYLSDLNYGATNLTDYMFEVNKSFDNESTKEYFGTQNVNEVNNESTSEVCPSRKYTMYNQVISAKTSDLANQCHSCVHCNNISLIQRIFEFYTELFTNYPNNEDGGLYIFIPTNRQVVSDSILTYFINLPPEINSAIQLNFIWADRKLQLISADLVPLTPDIEISNLVLEYNYGLFIEVLNFISNFSIQFYNPYTEENTMENDPKTEYIEISGDESEPESKVPIIVEGSIQCRYPSLLAHNQNPVHFPMPNEEAQLLNAPEFHPSMEEFTDPIQYFKDIIPYAAKFGICKVVAPQGYKPQCILDDSVRFTVTNQYISRLFKRWGSGLKELCAIKAYLASQSVLFNRPPLLDGIEVNLPKLYSLVQRYGGLPKVIKKKRWAKIAEEMRLTKTQKIGNKLDKIYVKYILPYDTLSQGERKELMKTVETHWEKKHQRMLRRALKPLHRQKRLLGESESSEEEVEDDIYVSGALNEAEDCITKGRLMKLSTYQKVAYKAAETYLHNPKTKTADDIEREYWRIVTEAKDHICVNSASIDTGEEGYGFTKDINDVYGTHPWNLKVLSDNQGNVLKSLGPVLGVTVPTLHLGMTFSTSCWHRDPHGLPWIEYMHTGPGKIWYGIPDEQSDNFRSAVENLCPTSCQKKSIWLPSDIVMIPPDQLLNHNVSLSRLVQKPGEYIIVFPKAYSCSISTGYTECESVYFAPFYWLNSIDLTFKELRENCEPTMFSIEQLLLSVARDPHTSVDVLGGLYLCFENIIRRELGNRLTLARYKVQDKSQRKRGKTSRKRPAGAWNVREQEECGICQATLYLSRVWGLTDKKQSICLQHALELLNRKQWRTRDLANVGLEVFLTETELERVITNIHVRLQNGT